jgi:hypothetical protein
MRFYFCFSFKLPSGVAEPGDEKFLKLEKQYQMEESVNNPLKVNGMLVKFLSFFIPSDMIKFGKKY